MRAVLASGPDRLSKKSPCFDPELDSKVIINAMAPPVATVASVPESAVQEVGRISGTSMKKEEVIAKLAQFEWEEEDLLKVKLEEDDLKIREIYGKILYDAIGYSKHDSEIAALLCDAGAALDGWYRAGTGVSKEAVIGKAIRHNRDDVVRLLLKTGLDGNCAVWRLKVEGRSEVLIPGLLVATNRDFTRTPNAYTIMHLLDAGANVNGSYRGGNGATPIHNVICGYLRSEGTDSLDTAIKVIKMLIDAGADVNIASPGRNQSPETPLQRAMDVGRAELIDLLLQAGANIRSDIRCLIRFSRTTDLLAKYNFDYNNYKEVITLLLHAGVHVNTDGFHQFSVLQHAVAMSIHPASGNEVVKLLLDHGADVRKQGDYYGSPLLAVFVGIKKWDTEGKMLIKAKDVVQLLIQRGASIFESARAGSLEGRTFFQCILQFDFETEESLIELLNSELESKKPDEEEMKLFFETQNDAGQTVLHLLVKKSFLEVITRLCSYRAPTRTALELQDMDGRNILHYAIDYGKLNSEVVSWLLARIRDTDARMNSEDITGKTPWTKAFTAFAELEKRTYMQYRECVRSLEGVMELASEAKNLDHVTVSMWFDSNLDTDEEHSVAVQFLTSDDGHMHMEFEFLTQRSSNMAFWNFESNPELYVNAWNVPGHNRKGDLVNGRGPILIIVKGSSIPDIHKLTAWKCTQWLRKGDRSPYQGMQHTLPSPAALRQKRREYCSVILNSLNFLLTLLDFLEFTFVLPVLDIRTGLDSTGQLQDALSSLATQKPIVWLMRKPDEHASQKSDKTSEAVGKQPLLATSAIVATILPPAFPTVAIELFPLFVKSVKAEWIAAFNASEEKLRDLRSMILDARGRNPELIRDLLYHATLWDAFESLAVKQIEALNTLHNAYFMKQWSDILRLDEFPETDSLLEEFKTGIEDLDKFCQKRIEILKVKSQENIQLEFSLTSITEAQTSTSMSISMKRLTWLTSLFGMNVDILEKSPHWWLYLPITAAAIIIVLLLWMVFKRMEGRFDTMLKRFSGASPLRQGGTGMDEEQSVELLSRSNTAAANS
ncbi:ankyrin [Ascobolus immersus RN42]|uniref:Ankyrin n=1 Tax=Ascobolus immersus RN42 TaxID=1160509 RepID=A0A3N4HU06_ASCIM|nr:ankyrin [Ascobolus immersus RN42]